MKKHLIFSSLLVLTACVQVTTLKTAQEVEDSITCTTDDFSSLTSCEMPLKSTCSMDGTDSYMNCAGAVIHSRLKLIHKEDKNAQFGISGYIWTPQSTYPHHALDASGKELDFEETDSIPHCAGSTCRIQEYILITLNKDYLKQHKTSGISIKIYGKRGNTRIEFPAHYVQGMLNYVQNNNIK